jgi:hypothetical protein
MGRQWSSGRQGVAGQAQQGRAADAVGADVLTAWRSAGLAGAGGRGRVCTARGAQSATATGAGQPSSPPRGQHVGTHRISGTSLLRLPRNALSA